MVFNKENALLIGAAAISIISLGVAAHNDKQTKKIIEEKNNLDNTLKEKINMGIDEILRKDSIDISQEVIKTAVNKAAERAIDKYGREAAEEAERRCKNEISEAANAAIYTMKNDIKPIVKQQLEKKAEQVSIDDIKAEIVESATREAESKIQAEMDQILLKHQQQLDAINNIYNNIGAAVKGGNNVIQVEA